MAEKKDFRGRGVPDKPGNWRLSGHKEDKPNSGMWVDDDYLDSLGYDGSDPKERAATYKKKRAASVKAHGIKKNEKRIKSFAAARLKKKAE
jgi:hypothetical protein